tara:strand:+ start:16376 stop:17113 length:738 start_codon:yes stop_codon:yes gene_type:complete
MRAFLYGLILSTVLASTLSANEIYITQIGDTLDLDITQDGSGNEFGDSTTDITLDGDDMTFSITQTGDSNVIDAVIKGNSYTGTWTFTGDSNTVDLECDSSGGVNCENVTLNIATVGDTNKYILDIGQSADADGAQVDFTIDGDGNILITSIDGESAVVDVDIDNSATSSSATTSDSSSTYTSGQGGVVVELDIDGDGDSAGHSVKLDITGGGSNYKVTQSGVGDNAVDGTFSGDGQDVDITQSD